MYSNNGNGHSEDAVEDFSHHNDNYNGNGHSSNGNGFDVRMILSSVGLSEPEVAVYLASLELGSRPASIIAQRARLKRGQTYNVLTTLLEKGVVQEFVKNSVRHFTCGTPESLLSLLENRERELKQNKERLSEILPELEKIRSPLNGKPKVRFFQGIEGVKEVFEDMLREETEAIYGLSDFDYSCTVPDAELDNWVKDFVKRRTEKGIKYYGIFKRCAAADSVLSHRPDTLREIRVIDSMDIPAEFFIYNGKVAIISTNGEKISLIIESAAISTALKNLYTLAWAILPPYKF